MTERSIGTPCKPLRQWLVAAAETTPDAIALESPQGRLSYAQLLHATREMSEQLWALALAPGDRVGIAAERSVQTVVAILAVVDCGLAYVPLDLNYPAERLAAMLADTNPRVVLGESGALERLRAMVGALPTLQQPRSGDVVAVQRVHAAADDLTYVLFTSGSTGRPKGVAMGTEPLARLIEFHATHPRLGKPARTLQFAPLSFDVHFQEIFSTLACGGTLVIVPEAIRRDPAQLHAALCELQIERLFLPYVALQMIADASHTRVPEHLREVISAGEQLQITTSIRSLFERLPQAQLHNHYGPTETHVVTAYELSGDATTWPAIPPIGMPLPHVQLSLRDPETGCVTDADSGELLLGGQTLAHGYLGRPELTAERFKETLPGLAGRWYATGDLVRRDAAGVYTYLGRIDQQLKVDGFRIEPGEIEVLLMAHAEVREAVVTAPEIAGAGRQLVAYVVPRDPQTDATALLGALRAHLRQSLPEYMVPVRYVVLEQLPVTSSGKIDRRALPVPEIADTNQATDALSAVRATWQELLGEQRIPDDENLFDLGARSLLVLKFVTRLKQQGFVVSVADVYDRPTLAGIAAVLDGSRQTKDARKRGVVRASGTDAIAIVGMAVRAAGADDLDAFWDNLIAGREGIRHYAPNELDASIPEAIRSRPNFVPARGALADVDRFDAELFGVSAREATVLDPQQRLLLELSWTALEHAGIDTARSDALIGVYAGSANNSYIAALRQEQPELINQYGEFATMLASEKDYVATRIAHRLNLNGPAVSIHTACSTGLVAVAQACQALRSGQCDLALAGGATVVVPQAGGYLHVEGGMESADGHCRPFDADASGTVFASGGAVVALKRLEDAQADGDTVYALIRGVGLNNDGADKASFTAPSVSGQAAAIRMALDQAGIDARSIGYVEAHGTGTALGDPIEVAALTRTWREHTAEVQFCAIGSVKSNLGHTIAAAGVIGLIKATLALQRQMIPATLHYRRPNPEIDFAATPFFVAAANTPWQRGTQPRRAAVSSFGVGGTNAHVVLEEAPSVSEPIANPENTGAWLLPLSAHTSEAAQRRAQGMAAYLERHSNVSLQDVAATLMRGRREMRSRLSVVARDIPQAIAALRGANSATTALINPRLVFLFPGQGSQHPGMARHLYEQLPAFRAALDRCLAVTAAELSGDFKYWLVEAAPDDAAVAALLSETRHAQPALFAMSYSLAMWLDSLNIRPQAMLGHSIGEYTAACLAGVMTPEAALRAVIARGAAMFSQPRGAMLAVRSDAATVTSLAPPQVEIAAINAPALTVVAGPADAIDAFDKTLAGRDIGTTRLRVSHAFHSASMDMALPKVAAALSTANLQAPTGTVYSCVSGAPLQAAQAIDPNYWAQQVRCSVQFSRAVQAELAHEDVVFVEVGPSQALTALIRQHRTARNEVPRIVSMLGPAQDPGDPAVKALQGLGALWTMGVKVAWPVPKSARRIALPTYPFQRDSYWFQRRAATDAPASGVDSAGALPSEVLPALGRLAAIEQELRRVMSDVSGISSADFAAANTFLEQGLDSLSMTQATLELERVFGVKLRFRRLLEDLDTLEKLGAFLDEAAPADRFAVPSVQPVVTTPAQFQPQTTSPPGDAHNSIVARQLQLIEEQLRLVRSMIGIDAAQATAAPTTAQPAAQTSKVAPPVTGVQNAAEPAQPAITLLEKPFGASARITLQSQQLTSTQSAWLKHFIARYNAKSGRSKSFSQANRKLMGDPRVVTGFNPMWKDLVYPIVVGKSKGARLWDLDGNEYIDLLSAFGANLLGYQPDYILRAMHEQLDAGIEVGPQHPLSAEVAQLIAEFTGMERVAFCNTGSEAVMGAMRIARTVTGRKTIAIFTNSYHGIFDEVIVRGTKQLRSLSAAPGILANAVENILVLDYGSDESLRVLEQRGRELAAIMIEPIQNKYPTFQPREFVRSLRQIADGCECALIFDEVVTGFRVAPGGAQEFYGVRADIATYGKVIGGGLPFAAIAGDSHWLDALDGGQWQYGDESYPEAGVTYFAGTFVRHPLALAAAKASLLHLKKCGPELYRQLNARTQTLVERLNTAFAQRSAPVRAVHCASLWRLQWEDDQKYVSLFYYLARFHGLHLYEQFGHFMTDAFGAAEIDRIVAVFTAALDELMALGFITANGVAAPNARTEIGAQPLARTEAKLSPGQTERWLAASFDVNARRALNESFCVTLRGAVDMPALIAALQDVLARHEAFRLRFDAEQPRQYLQPETPIPVQQLDLAHQADADAALDAFCAQASRREFPLAVAPLAAISLLTLADGRRVVHVVASHLIFDGWASSVFNAELAQAYRARSLGAAPTLEPAESPLLFAEREQARFETPEAQEALRFWTNVLKDPPPRLSLGDLQPALPRSFAADTARMIIDAETFEGLRTQARQSGATLFQLLLTAVTLLLHRKSGQEDFVVSIPYASQSLDRHAPLLADGVLDLPLRLTCSANETPEAVLQRVRDRLMDALEQPLMTQGIAARALGIRSSGDRAPLSGVFFNLNPRVDLSGWAPLGATLHEGRKHDTLNELFFNFYEHTDSLTLDLHYSTEHFSAARAQELLDSLRHICTSLAASLCELPQASFKLDQRLLEWNATDAPLAAGARVEQWIARQAQQTPDAIAIQAMNGSLTYRQLECRANQFGNLLLARGIGAGRLVGLCLSRGIDLLPALLGVLKSGAAYVPLDPGFPQERLHYMAEDAELALVITESAHGDLSGVERARQIRIDEDAASLDAAATTAPPISQWSDDAPMYVIYTSGSTGKPKGVVVSQQAVCNFLASMRKRPGMQAADRWLAVTTLSFDIAVLELLLPLTLGARVVIAQREQAVDGEVLAGMLAEHGITIMQATPTTWHMLLDAGWRPRRDMRALCGGESLPPALAMRLLESGVELWNMYGPTETTVWSTLARIGDAQQKISIGAPIDNTQVWILDEQRRPCAIGAQGEICIGGAGVALGYFKRPELTAEKFVDDPFRAVPGARLYRTGDLGRWCEDGTIEHLGRLDFQVKIRGYRIELGEIEARMEALPGVARAVALAREDGPGDVRLVGYFVAQPGADPDPMQIRDALRKELPDYMLPQHVVLLASLPLLPNGKINRRDLPAPGGPGLARTIEPPRNETERVVANAMQMVLKIPPVDVRDDFFSLGGHSLLAARLIGQINRELGVQLALRTLFESPTVETFAAAIDKQKSGPSARRAPIVHRPDQRTAPLTLMQERIRFIEEMYPGRVTYNAPSAHRLTGPLDVQAFERAFAQLLQRQPSLRTTIVANPQGGFMQLVNAADDFTLLPVEDLSHLPITQREAVLTRRIEELTAQCFELDKFPLFKHRLIKLRDDEHALFFMPHHIVWDGWSFDVFYAEIAELYAAAVAGRTPSLPSLPVTYGDFAQWHAQWLHSDEIRRQVDFWKGQYANAPPPKDPPTDKPRQRMSSGEGATAWLHIDTASVEQVRDLAKQTGSTMSIVALSVYAALMSEWLDDSRPVIGMPVRGRPVEELEGVMGFFNNLVPMRVSVHKSLSCLEWIKAVRQMVVAVFANQDVPFEMLAQELQLNRKGAPTRLYQVMFSFQDARQRQTQWGPLQHERILAFQKGATEDINLWMVEIPSGIEGGIQYNTDLFLPATAEALRDRFLAMLAGLSADPHQSVEQLLSATRTERGVPDASALVVAPAPTAAEGGLQTPAERMLGALWSRLLDIPVVHPQDNFFELGGASLLAMQMIAQVEQQTGKRLNPRVVLLSSLRQLGRELEGGQVQLHTSGSVRDTQPFFFAEGLFGILHRPQGNAAGRGVLICAPIAQEYMRTHWLFRQLAGQLAREGIAVMRFDYTGCGDSVGAQLAGGFKQWTQDAMLAAAEFRRRTDLGQLTVLGARLGACIAAAAFPQDDLVLWDPIRSGADYLDQLKALQAAKPRGKSTDTLGLAGFEFSEELRAELEAVNLQPLWDAAQGTKYVVDSVQLGEPVGWADIRYWQDTVLSATIVQALKLACVGGQSDSRERALLRTG